MKLPEGNAVVYCEGAFNTPNGKTAHGLVRFTKRYNVIAVIDKKYSGKDAGKTLDNKPNGIRICSNLDTAIKLASRQKLKLSHFVIGIAPDGGRLSSTARDDVKYAITKGLNIDSGLHDFLSEDESIVKLAKEYKVQIRDIRKPLTRDKLHFFEGKIEKVNSFKIALLGTDSAVGKRTTAWVLVNGLHKSKIKAELIGTGQTAWMQGAKYSIVLDSIVNDFVSGEIEHAVYQAWKNEKPEVIVIEGQGSLMNPAYPGGFEILAAGRPDAIILQHAPARKEYDGFPGYPLHPLAQQIKVMEDLSGKPVIAIAINHEDIPYEKIDSICETMEAVIGLPVVDVLTQGEKRLVELIKSKLKRK
ncbi:MAG: DUF1611 domain-containing protein [Bacteroidetes bacterium]|nr:DUF1611 domain-containing protein [Bacteroidota bacterium]